MKTFFSFLRKIFPPKKGLVSTDTKKSKKYITSYDVFISKKTEDSKMAHEVCSFLESNGYRCFISERELLREGNTNYYQTIDQALEHSTNMVVICSRAEYLQSKWVMHEWQTFSNELISSKKNGNLITIRGKNVKREDIPFTLRNLELLNWQDYKEHLLSYMVKLDNPKIHHPYSEAFMLGMNIGKFALDNIKGDNTSVDIINMKNMLIEWNLPMEKIEPLLQPGKGMDFLNSIIDILGEKNGNIHENCAYLGTIYIFLCILANGGANYDEWKNKFINTCKKLGVPRHIFQRIQGQGINSNDMIELRDIIKKSLDNLDNSVTKCPCCNARVGFDYNECPACGFIINR